MEKRKTCIFFGHRDAPDGVRPLLEKAIQSALTQGVTDFYVGNRGRFDRMVIGILERCCQEQSFRYGVVVSDFTQAHKEVGLPTVIPDGVELAPRRFAIDRCNRWMVKQADIVIAYIAHDFGGAAQYVQQAKRKGISVINLAESNEQ